MDIVGQELTPNVQYRIVTEQGFNAITVLDYINRNYQLYEVYIAIYRMNEQSVRKLIELVDNADASCNIILSSFFRENKRYEKWCHDLIAYANNSQNTRISFAWNHAKVFLGKTTNGQHIVFEGSGNLSDNARIEQYLIEDNVNTYEFHKKWMGKILDNESTERTRGNSN